MESEERLNELIGTHLSTAEMYNRFSSAEIGLLTKLSVDFGIKPADYTEIVRALYRFKRLLEHYNNIWGGIGHLASHSQREEARKVLGQVDQNLNRNSRSCFSNSNFFGKIRFLLHACEKLHIPERERRKYLKWVLNFPVIPISSRENFFSHEIYPANLPHLYMHRVSGFIRDRLVDKKTSSQISTEFRTFLRELNIPKSHARWFNKRLSGSYGSRQ